MMSNKSDTNFNDGFLLYIQNKLNILKQSSPTDKYLEKITIQSINKKIQLFENMKTHYQIAKKQFQSQICIDPAQNGNPQVLRQNNGALAQILVYGSLINQQTLFKHQMMSINQSMFEQFDSIKTKILDPLLGIEDDQQITIQQTIRKVNVQINRILDNKKLNNYLRQLDCLKGKFLNDSKQQVVIQQQQEQQKDQKQQILKINNSSSESYKGKKNMIQNYQGDEQVFTGDSDHKIHQKKYLSKKLLGKKKNPKKKYVQQQNYYASQQEQKHKKKAINWRYHTNQQGFDTDKEKITDDKK